MNRSRLLMVDDDRLVLATLSRGLQGAGYDVEVAQSPQEALAVLEQFQPDLALLDIRMGDSGGFALARELQARAAIPFLFLSAYNDAATVEEATELGAVGFVVKPVDIPQLRPAVEAALKRAAELSRLRTTGRQLEQALEQQRGVSVAIGILMERHHWSRSEAEARLRETARAQRRKMAELAEGIVVAGDALALSALDPERR
jgi:AmiR/NasT family two-component response regulator